MSEQKNINDPNQYTPLPSLPEIPEDNKEEINILVIVSNFIDLAVTKIAKTAVQEMSLDQYWKFRNDQINDIKQSLQNINLTAEQYGEIPEQLWQQHLEKLPWIKKIASAKKTYFNQLITLYNNIAIQSDQNNQNQAFIKEGDKILVIISIDQSNNTIFKIDTSLTTPQLNKAIILMIEQVVKYQDRSGHNKLEIAGYHHNPEIVLKLYQLAILQDCLPEISNNILKTWEEKANV